MTTTARVHFLDNLRALAMLAGIPFHAALAFSPLMQPIWPAANDVTDGAVDVAAWFVHLFRMPLFFALSGYFAAVMVARRGLSGFFRDRLARIALPLVVFAPLVLVALDRLTEHAAREAIHPSPALAWLRAYLDQHGGMPPTMGWAHLWFLFYLLLFTLLTWVASALDARRIGDALFALPAPLLLAAFPLATAPALAMVGAPWPAPDAFVPSLWALLYFGAFFAFGFRLHRDDTLLDRLEPLLPWLLVGAVAAYAGMQALTDGFAIRQPSTTRHALVALCEACAGSWMTFACLLVARRWLRTHSAVLRWLSEASYWTYLVHLPVLLAVQYPLRESSMHAGAKFAIAVVTTFALSLGSYRLLVQPTFVGRWLAGRTTRSLAPVKAGGDVAA